MGMNLFDGSDPESDDEEPKIEIDKEFARRYEHNKKREDLHRYEELKKRGLAPDSDGADDSDKSESSSDEDITPGHSKKKNLKFFDALIKVKKQDPSLKNKDVVLFTSDSESDSDDNEESKDGKEKKKPMYLKDVVAKHLLEEGPEFGNDEEEHDNRYGGRDERIKRLVYDAEQERVRNEFLKAAEQEEEENGENDQGELLKVKVKAKGESEEDSDDEELKKKVDEYFGDEPDENSKFLKNYFVNKMWIDKRNGDEAEDDDENDDLEILSEDEQVVDMAEEFEYRYQEDAGDRVLGHTRKVEGTVRKTEKARKEQRKHKEERIKAAKIERDAELRRLKNLKRKEMDERLQRIMDIAGIKSDEIVPLSARELEEEFDPEEYDRMMKKAFGDEYYDAEVDPEGDSEDDDEAGKPNFDEEDELLGLEKGWDGRNTGEIELMAEREVEEDEEEKEEEKEEEVREEGKRKRKRKSAILEKAREAMLDEYFKLDYEDTIGDLKTRFKYAKTNPNRYGLNTSEILAMDDKELGQFVPLKKIAPYKDEDYRVPGSKISEIKELLRNKKLTRDPKSERNKKKKDKVFDEDKEIGRPSKKNKKKREFDEDKPSSSNGEIVSKEENEEPVKKKKKKKNMDSDEEQLFPSNSVISKEEGKQSKKKNKKNNIDEDEPSSPNVNTQDDGEPSKLSKTAKRRKNRAEYKLSESRLKAYGKIESSSKKAKH